MAMERNKISRRRFVNNAGTLMGLGMMASPFAAKPSEQGIETGTRIAVKNVDSNFEREPLTPYRFKGSAITEAWQIAARIETESGNSAIGLGTQNILWSDSKVFAAHSQSGGNALMYTMTERALEMM